MNRREFGQTTSAAFAVGMLADSETKGVKEQIPSEEGIASAFKELLAGSNYSERRREPDTGPPAIWEIEVQTTNGTAELGYYKKKIEGASDRLYLTFYDEDGMPEAGRDIAKYVDGEWDVDFGLVEEMAGKYFV